eukprot:3673813-Pyramimonas_sp.AAC.1
MPLDPYAPDPMLFILLLPPECHPRLARSPNDQPFETFPCLLSPTIPAASYLPCLLPPLPPTSLASYLLLPLRPSLLLRASLFLSCVRRVERGQWTGSACVRQNGGQG